MTGADPGVGPAVEPAREPGGTPIRPEHGGRDLEPDEPDEPDELDEGPPPAGPRRILLSFYAIFALAAISRGVVQLATQFAAAPLAYLLSLFSGLVYLGAAAGLATGRRFSRPLAWAACGTEMVGVLVIGTASLIDAKAFPRDTVWSHFGSGYGYFPLLLPVLGLMYLGYTRGRTADADAPPS